VPVPADMDGVSLLNDQVGDAAQLSAAVG
jgi:hypothetical protein